MTVTVHQLQNPSTLHKFPVLFFSIKLYILCYKNVLRNEVPSYINILMKLFWFIVISKIILFSWYRSIIFYGTFLLLHRHRNPLLLQILQHFQFLSATKNITIAILINNAFKTVQQSAKNKEDIWRRISQCDELDCLQ